MGELVAKWGGLNVVVAVVAVYVHELVYAARDAAAVVVDVVKLVYAIPAAMRQCQRET